MEREERLKGCLLGTAVGDALGLAREGLTAERGRKMFGPLEKPDLLFGRGMVSDDTELTVLTLQSLQSADTPEACASDFARRLRRWVLLIPPGVGLATARAGWRGVFGRRWDRMGVPSAGNGAAMRAAIFGAWFGNDPRREAFVLANARVTHTDSRAIEAAIRVAAWAAGEPLPVEASIPNNSNGFAPTTMATVAGCLAAHPRDLQAGVRTAIEAGGDTDTIAAIVGGILGARLEPDAVPPDWITSVIEQPRSMNWMRDLARGSAKEPIAPLLFVRNLFLLVVVLFHGFRRLLPPY
ncbi:ADP-ribosylglycohydrolase family protein [bacterium]|nr:MAG: ADP-ribosylglycohydrolase family protein [bacterium]